MGLRYTRFARCELRYNGNRTECSPIPSVIIRVIIRSKLVKTVTKFEKETGHRLFVIIKKLNKSKQNETKQKTKIMNSAKCETTVHAHDVFCPFTQI